MPEESRPRVGTPVRLGFPCAGLEPGSKVHVKVLQAFDLGGDPVETFDAEVDEQGLARATWTYDHDKHKEKVDAAVFVLVAEASGRVTASRPIAFVDLFTAQVKDASGQPAAHRQVVLHAERGSNVEARTDGRGKLSVLVPPGNYHVELTGDSVSLEERIPDPQRARPDTDESASSDSGTDPAGASSTPGDSGSGESAAPRQLRVLLLDDDHRPLPGVAWNAEGATPASGTADGDGVAELELAPGAERASISWQASGTTHTVSLWAVFPADRAVAARRRLDNLGFTRGPTLERDIAAFQINWGQVATGKLDDIEAELIDLHDNGARPDGS